MQQDEVPGMLSQGKTEGGRAALTGSSPETGWFLALLAHEQDRLERPGSLCMKEYVAGGWASTLRSNGLGSFDRLWALSGDWVESPNLARGGFSGVSRYELALGDGTRVGVFVKRQENHTARTLRHPWQGIPTLAREFDSIRRCQRFGLGTVEPIYYGEQRRGGSLRAVLLSCELADYQSLAQLESARHAGARPPPVSRRPVLLAIAGELRRLHGRHLQHGSLYPKHIFVRRREDGSIDVRILDLEKTRRRLLPRRAMLRDLDTLNRHAEGWSRTQRLRFLLAYLGTDRLTPRGRRLWHQLAQRAEAKKTRARDFGRTRPV